MLYDKLPLPLGESVVTLKSVKDIPPPPPPVKSEDGAQLLPLYFSTCPLLAPAVLTSDKSFKALVMPVLVIVNVSGSDATTFIPDPPVMVNVSVGLSAAIVLEPSDITLNALVTT